MVQIRVSGIDPQKLMCVISRDGALHLALRQSALWRKKNNQWPITDPSSSTDGQRTEDQLKK